MLKSLRWQLTLLYLLAAVGLVGLVGGGTYLLIDRYFQQTTDLALRYAMANQFRLNGFSLPEELTQSETEWIQNNRNISQSYPTTLQDLFLTGSDGGEGVEEHQESEGAENQGGETEPNGYSEEHRYDADLAAIFVIVLDASGQPIQAMNSAPSLGVSNDAAYLSARLSGFDERTVLSPGHGRVRLLTYRTGSNNPAFIQTGRYLSDQDRVLNQFLLSLAILGGAASALLALVSWWLAGRSLHPVQKAWDQQQAFVSNASHELRTPLTLIRATTEYSLRNQPTPAQEHLLTDILGECDFMDKLVDDLLLLSRVDAQRLKLVLEPILLADLFSETIHEIEKLAQTAGVILAQQDTQEGVTADRIRLRQVLLILLDNALRFTPSGGSVHLSARRTGKQVQIDVRDTGKGIAAEHLAHLFERFYQVQSSENDASRSNGLGLGIARGLTEAQGGAIRIASQPGQGTTVSIFLPVAQVD